jgi:restriction endonuclease S subunit
VEQASSLWTGRMPIPRFIFDSNQLLYRSFDKLIIGVLMMVTMAKELEQAGKVLPEGWKWVQLGEICTIQNGYAFKSSDFIKKGIPVIKMGNIAKDFYLKWDTKNPSYLPEKYLDLYPEFVIFKSDLLIALTDMSPSGEYLGTVALYNQNFPAFLNQRVGRFTNINHDLLNINYLYFCLRSQSFRKYATCDDTGNLQKNTNPEYLHKYTALCMITPYRQESKRLTQQGL